MTKKLIFSIALLIAPFICNAIDIDGDFTDWDTVTSAISDNEDVNGTWSYYNSNGGTWSTTCPVALTLDGSCPAFTVNQEQQLDVMDFKITTSADYIYFYFNMAEPFGSVKNNSNGAYTDRNAFGVPAAYDHWLVVNFDNTDDGEADYFYAINVTWDSQGDGFPYDNPVGYIYQDADYDGVFDLNSENDPTETLLETISLSSSDWKIEDENYEPKLELRHSFNDFIAKTNIDGTNPVNITITTDSVIGDSTSSLSYTIQQASSASAVPGNLKAGSVKAVKANLSWGSVYGATEYQAQLRLNSGTLVKNYYTSSTSQKIDKTVLISNESYKFRVRSKIDGAYSDWSDYVIFQTLPGKPKNLTINKLQADQFQLKWSAPRGTVTKYRVKFYDQNKKLIETYVTKKTQKNINGLNPSTKYRVKVKAFNSTAKGRFSIIKEFTTSPLSYYLKIADTTEVNLDIATPGADVDAVKITDESGKDYYAVEVADYNILDGASGNINYHKHFEYVLGEFNNNYVSLGGSGGYVIVRYSKPVNYQIRNITVKELGSSTGGYDEYVKIYVGDSKTGPWYYIGEGSGEFVINM